MGKLASNEREVEGNSYVFELSRCMLYLSRPRPGVEIGEELWLL